MLDGLRVLDLTRVLAGPLCTMMLGDLGADVIKVERPGSGDDTRGWGPPFNDRGESAYFLSANRNKLSIAADLGDDRDLGVVRGLIAAADVVIDNFPPGALQRRGLDPDVIVAERPDIIWCSISGFGPGADRPGYDFVIQAETGWMSITGEPDGRPMRVGVAIADVLAGKDAAIAILAARAGRGAGRRIHISLAGSAAAGLMNVAQNAIVSGRVPERWGNAHPNLVPYQLFDAADFPIVIAVGSDAQWRSCAAALDLRDLLDDPTLATNAGRIAARSRIVERIADRVRGRTADEWLRSLAAARVPSGRVKSVTEALREIGGSSLTGMPPSVPGTVRRPPPVLDEHGDLIRRHGWDAFEVVPP